MFSTNRLEYLIPTLESFQKNLDFGGHEVFGIFIDDYPKNRNDGFVEALAKKYDYQKIILHSENMGLSSTWQELFTVLGNYQFDYIWMQEDDVLLEHPVKLDDMLELFSIEPQIQCLTLQRQAWYFHEQEFVLEATDRSFKNYYYQEPKPLDLFSPISTLFPYEISQLPYKQITGCNVSENIVNYVMSALGRPLVGTFLKSSNGSHLINHIGDYSHGKRVCEGEPGWDFFKRFDPNKKYYSKSGVEVREE